MGSELELAAKEPWWSKAPAYLAVSIVGVPSLIAISAGWYIAGNINHRINILDQYTLSELHQLSVLQQEHKKLEGDFSQIQGFMRAALRAAQQGCLSNAKTPEQRAKCVQIPDPPPESSDGH